MGASVVFVAAPAKLNLRLLVGGLGADGYHPVQSLMVTLGGLTDTVLVEESAKRSVSCPGVAERENLAWRALDALEHHIGRALPCAISIEKHIPAQAGLGGGSSDAAAALIGVNELYSLSLADSDLEQIGATVGSDVPFFIRGGAQWAHGRGERLSAGWTPDFGAVIVKPSFGLATPDVYRAFDTLPAPPPHEARPVPDTFAELVTWVRNDLWPAALACRPELAGSAAALVAAGASCALLCGSGTAVAGLFPTREEAMRAAGRCPEAVAVVSPTPARQPHLAG